MLPETDAVDVGSVPKDLDLAQVFADCPHCGREEFFLVFRDQRRAVVQCQFGNALDWHNGYVITYEVRTGERSKIGLSSI